MNYFTKEELIMLKNGVEYLSDRTSLSDQYIDKCNTISHKIQSMIDNYCDHKPSDNCAGECVLCSKDLCFECGKEL